MTKGHKEACGGHGSVHYLGCAGGFMSTYVCQNTSKCTLRYVPVIVCLSLLYLNKAVKKKER